ncbi:SWIM zinc finger family protein [Diaphorobacter sp. HDW4B]|uniref:SWIM zinc finger family protein n=1 Tax=Diaphorobacter sp. HDW4B TaxID=2714925 RepID=UPI00140D0FCA|nr:SWIM zinc finger family protein [Diaphorobacter sp. HDW4B]QIL72348.1 SWIM zinc finger family protein [Diaphorobacter sp. HDW4B]
MEFRYQYYGTTNVSDTAAAQSFSFAPDLLRPPVRFDGTLKRDGLAYLQVREGLSALHDVVVSDMRTRGRDKTAYQQWLAEHESQLLADFMADTGGVQARLTEIGTELRTLRSARDKWLKPFYQAQRKYFEWLYQNNKDLWYVLDPVITVHPDRLLFEAFSQDESSYCSVSVQHAAFEHAGEMQCGTTNIDYSSTLYEEFQKIRNYKDTRLQLDPAGFDVQTGTDPGLREEKIDLPDSWLRGFLQVSSAMALPATVIELHAMDLFNICAQLRGQREKHGPRSMRFELMPNAAPVIVFEPWEKRLVTKRSKVVGEPLTYGKTIRMWGRRRLLTLERLISQATRVRVHLLGTGMPSFWVIDMGLVTVTLGLSGWSSNDWSASARFHLMAPQADVKDADIQVVGNALQSRWQASADELAAATGLSTAQVHTAMTNWMHAGRAVYDLSAERYAWRELLREPITADQVLVPASPEEEAALTLIRDHKVPMPTLDYADGYTRIRGKIARANDGKRFFEAQLELNADEQMTDATCTCNFFQQHRMYQGPCQHMVALRLMAQPELDANRTHARKAAATVAAASNDNVDVNDQAQKSQGEIA